MNDIGKKTPKSLKKGTYLYMSAHTHTDKYK